MKSKRFRANLITYAIVIAAFIACQVLISTGVMTRSLKGQLVPICAYIVMAISLNLTVGISGELSLGHAGFMSVGAFSGIVMSMWLSKGMGLDNKTVVLLMAIITGGVAAGMAGALYGLNFSTVAASKFKFDTSILVLVFVVLGGIGNIRGSIISATLLTILPELLRAFANYRMLIYAIVLILVMLATNNPTLRSLVQRIIPHKKGQKKEADEA